MWPWLLLVGAEALMIVLVVIDRTVDRDEVEEFVMLAIFGGVGAFVMGNVLSEDPSIIAGAGALAILGGIVGSGFRPVVSLRGPWWRQGLVAVGALAGVAVSFVIWP